ncbi:hypothetical protein [Methylibium sp.]|uniref:hypothetical protein n=1 Tax=Methylibium sp. TaxID=2067992 RepID=UPI00345BD14F
MQLHPDRGAFVAVPTRDRGRPRRAATPVLLEHEVMHSYDQPAWMRLASGFHLRLAALARNPIRQRYLQETVSRCALRADRGAVRAAGQCGVRTRRA